MEGFLLDFWSRQRRMSKEEKPAGVTKEALLKAKPRFVSGI